MRSIFAAAVLALLAGCTTGEEIGGLRQGMSPDQVADVLGQPDGVQSANNQLTYQYANRLMSGWSWDRADYAMVFVDDQLVAWGPGTVRQQAPNHGLPIAGAALIQSATQPPPAAQMPCYRWSLGVTC